MIYSIRNLTVFKKYPITKEFTKFCMVGATNLVVDMGIYLILTRVFGLYYILAATLSFAVAITWSFYVNRKWTFRHNGTDLNSQYIKFTLVNLFGLVVNLSLFYLMVDMFLWNDIISKLIITVIVAFINFSLSKFWAFKNKKLKIEINEI